MLLKHGLANNDFLESVLAQDDVLQGAGVFRLRLHQLHEAVGHLVPLPVDHDIEDAGQGDGLRAQHDTLTNMQTDVTIGQGLAPQHHNRLPVYLSDFCLEHLQVDYNEFGWRGYIKIEVERSNRALFQVCHSLKQCSVIVKRGIHSCKIYTGYIILI